MELYTDIRDKKRFNCNTEISHDNLLPDVFYAAKMYNFSKGGLYFESDQHLYIGDYINIRIKLPDRPSENHTQHQFGVEILWRQEAQNSSFKYGYGSKFINPDQTLENVIDLSQMEQKPVPTEVAKEEGKEKKAEKDKEKKKNLGKKKKKTKGKKTKKKK